MTSVEERKEKASGWGKRTKRKLSAEYDGLLFFSFWSKRKIKLDEIKDSWSYFREWMLCFCQGEQYEQRVQYAGRAIE